jgi:O-antigen ligase
VWSDDPVWSLKHWIATLGNAVMALIILTEPDPEAALKWMLKACSFVTIPISILLIRYYPQWGRCYNPWDGEVQKAGFACEKNSLGVICMTCGYFFAWHLLNTLRLPKSNEKRDEILLCATFFLMIAYLFKGLHCATALVSMIVGITVIVLINLPMVDKRLALKYLVIGVVLLALEETTLGLRGQVIQMLGKDPTLTSRTPMWANLLAFDSSPILGAGNDGFWLPDREKAFWGKYYKPQDSKPNEAHNGYLEAYLNLGVIGLVLLLGWIIATFKKCQMALVENYRVGLFRLGFLVGSIFYNWTEAGFKTITPVFFMFFLISMDYPNPEIELAAHSVETETAEAETEVASVKA